MKPRAFEAELQMAALWRMDPSLHPAHTRRSKCE
ncbi:MAG: hypothetical protein JWM27_2081 [Gemmatimonadetes bacterium]|nr:hypothetical protein [Gemmatimonadota bacterium]